MLETARTEECPSHGDPVNSKPHSKSKLRLRLAAIALAVAAALALVLVSGCSSQGSSASPSAQSEPSSTSAEGQEGARSQDDDYALTAVGAHGALAVDGTHLVDSDGNPYQLRGLSTHGLAWFPQYVSTETFKTLRDEWGANCMRLAMYTHEHGGYCSDGNQAALEALVDEGVEAASELGMYVIVDWHVLNEQSPLGYESQAIGFFDKMSSKYADNDNVLYEICNEPNGSATWTDVREYASNVIPVIRANDPDALVIVGTPTWSQDVDKAASAPLEFDNVMYALHFYAATHTQWLRDRVQAALDAGLPIFVSEFGLCDASGSGANDLQEAEAWLGFLDANGISYVAWNLSNKDEASAVIASSSDKVSDWSDADLSESGLWLKGWLGSHSR